MGGTWFCNVGRGFDRVLCSAQLGRPLHVQRVLTNNDGVAEDLEWLLRAAPFAQILDACLLQKDGRYALGVSKVENLHGPGWSM